MSREGAVSPNNLAETSSDKTSRDQVWRNQARTAVTIVQNNLRWLLIALLILLFAGAALYEVHTSVIQAKLFSAIASRLSYSVGPGPSPRITFPATGPLNETRGYADLLLFTRHLMDAGFHVVEQARLSSGLEKLTSWGITPPYREPPAAGLVIRGERGVVLYDAESREHLFRSYGEIPPLVVKALLFVENRELEDSSIPTRNPVVDWGRSAKAAFQYAGHKLGLPLPLEGGSTLATQIEKFRYGNGGRTHSPADKLRQMLSASLRVYRSGPDTTGGRREIVLDYLNSVPLAAASRYGEVHGLGNGLHAWFDIELGEALSVMNGRAVENDRMRIVKHILALICAARAPSYYLLEDRPALEARVDYYVRQLLNAGLISPGFARGVLAAPLEFLDRAPAPQPVPYVQRKAANAIRTQVMKVVGARDFYTLDRLHLDVDTTLNSDLQTKVLGFFEKLKDRAFVDAAGLREEHLLSRGDPANVMYSFTLFERAPFGNILRVQADTLNQPFDLNEGMKLELGSTAKLRTLAHYLELVASLYHEIHDMETTTVAQRSHEARDPITRWVADKMMANATIDLETLLDDALDRQYSGSTAEMFFTGGGAHTFTNFDNKEDGMIFTLREGLKHSVNLVYIRLMRDLVRFHQARLQYDPGTVLYQTDDSNRRRLLKEIADTESEKALYRAYRTYRDLGSGSIVDQLLGTRNKSARRLAMVFFAWNPKADASKLKQWLQTRAVFISKDESARLLKAYNPAHLNISDYGYLLNRHPLDIWCAGQLIQNPKISWDDLLNRSVDARDLAYRWLFQTRNRHAQDLRLRIRFEQDAFNRMTAYWRRLGFPFGHLVPSLATAIGSSADRPVALAELMGIILNDGVRFPLLRVRRLHFAADTPYETVFEPEQPRGESVMEPAVARALRRVLAEVVQDGTAGRLANTFIAVDGKPIVVGGKTGSGDNRYKTFGRGGHLKTSRAVSRTGTFVFYIGDRYFGVMTAYVGDKNAADYAFTSALPVAALKVLAPAILTSLIDSDCSVDCQLSMPLASR